MTNQIERILWCPDCMTKHARDLLHHAEARKDSRLKKIAQKAFDISSNMLKVKDKKLYSNIRDLEHHTEDLLTGLRTERKKLTEDDCPNCGDIEEIVEKIRTIPKDLNRGNDKLSNSIQNKEISMSVIQPLIGSFIGKGISEATTRFVPGATFGMANKTLLNLGIGVVIDALSVFRPGLFRRAEVPLVTAANFLIADEVGDLIAGYVPAAVRVPAPAVTVTPTAVGVPQFSNKQHIYVD